MHELENLPDDSEDIECSNMLKRYAQRPKTMENVTLVNYAANYSINKQYVQKRNVLSKSTTEGLLLEQIVSDNEDAQSDDEIDNTNEYHKVKSQNLSDTFILILTPMKKNIIENK